MLDILRDKKMDNSFQASLREDTPWKEASNRVLTLAFALLSCRTLDGALSDSFLLCKNRLMPPPTELLGSHSHSAWHEDWLIVWHFFCLL